MSIQQRQLEAVALGRQLAARRFYKRAKTAKRVRVAGAFLFAVAGPDNFLDNVKDWGEISSEISDMGPSRIREATRALNSDLQDLDAHGLAAYAGCRRLIIEGGVGPPAYWWEFAVKVVRSGPQTSREDTK